MVGRLSRWRRWTRKCFWARPGPPEPDQQLSLGSHLITRSRLLPQLRDPQKLLDTSGRSNANLLDERDRPRRPFRVLALCFPNPHRSPWHAGVVTWRELTAQQIMDMPLDDLAILVLEDWVVSNQWNLWNFLCSTRELPRSARNALSEAQTWLLNHGCLARDPDQTDHEAAFVTRAGHALLEQNRP